jgi:xylulokinase
MLEMDDSYFISVEFSTKRTKAAIFDARASMLTSDYEEPKLIYPKPGWVEQDPMDFYRSAVNTIRNSLRRSKIDPRNVKAIAFSSQMAGIMGVDGNWTPVTRYDSWLDIRCRQYVDFLSGKYQDLLIDKVGAPPSITHGPKILWWKNERKKVFDKISKFITPNCYVAGKMAGLKGEDAFIDYTFLHFTGFCDSRKGEWSEELCHLFNVPMDKFPEIVEPWKIIGELTQVEARKLGLVKGIPIVAGAGNQATRPLGAGIVKHGMIFDSTEAASVFSCCVNEYVPDRRYRTFVMERSVIPGLWMALSYIAGGGLCLKWFINELAHLNGGTRDRNQVNSELLEKQSSKIPMGSEGLMFIPHFRGRAYPCNPKLKGVWFGLDWKHTKAHLYRSILESIAYEYFYYMTILRKLFPELTFKEGRVIGEGADSDLWNQIKADVLGVPYVRIRRQGIGVLGLTLIAGYAVGVYKDLVKTASKISKEERVTKPRSVNNYQYRKYAKKYLKILSNIEFLFQKIDDL